MNAASADRYCFFLQLVKKICVHLRFHLPLQAALGEIAEFLGSMGIPVIDQHIWRAA